MLTFALSVCGHLENLKITHLAFESRASNSDPALIFTSFHSDCTISPGNLSLYSRTSRFSVEKKSTGLYSITMFYDPTIAVCLVGSGVHYRG